MIDPNGTDNAGDRSSPPAIAWDTEIDTPASVLVIGGGPVGIEAALYARFLGYSVTLVERRRVGHSLTGLNELPLREAWGSLTSTLGLAALEAQGDLPRHGNSDYVSSSQFVEDYLLPVARTDLLHDAIQFNCEVLSISRCGCNPLQPSQISRRADQEFRVLIRSQRRGEYAEFAEVILDCSGLAARSGMATGGGLAAGEDAANAMAAELAEGGGRFFTAKEFRTNDSHDWSNQRIVVYGDNLEACQTVADLAATREQAEQGKLTWLIPKICDSPLEQQFAKTLASSPWQIHETLESRIQSLRSSATSGLLAMEVQGISNLSPLEPHGWQLQVQSGPEDTLAIDCDVLINCADARADWRFAESLLLQPLTDIRTSEPHYYVLGQKSQGQQPISLADCRQQIRQAFGMIGGRPALDLYDTVRPQGAS